MSGDDFVFSGERLVKGGQNISEPIDIVTAKHDSQQQTNFSPKTLILVRSVKQPRGEKNSNRISK
jgi:hypothetical protein